MANVARIRMDLTLGFVLFVAGPAAGALSAALFFGFGGGVPGVGAIAGIFGALAMTAALIGQDETGLRVGLALILGAGLAFVAGAGAALLMAVSEFLPLMAGPGGVAGVFAALAALGVYVYQSGSHKR